MNIYRGYRIRSNHNFEKLEIQKAIDLITRTDLCETCVDFRQYDLKIGNLHYNINHAEKTIIIR